MARVQSAIRRGGGKPASRRQFLAASGALAALAAIPAGAQEASPVASPVSATRTITYANVASLSHSLTPDSPVWPGRDPFQVEPNTTVAADGFYGNILRHHEHVGTHLDAPAHFVDGGVTVDGIDPATLVAPLVILDVTVQAAADVDYAVAVDDILAWEAEYGPLPEGAFVAFTSGWSARFTDAEAFVNLDADGVQHYPGFHPDTAAFLVGERNIVGIGSDTLSQDPGNSTDFGTHVTILGAGLYGVEGVANLDGLPASGATVIVGGPNHANGSGGLARLIALY
jgi:kynurenine formamidase